MEKIFISNSSTETMELAKRLAPIFPDGTVLCFTGDLGVGKTTFVRGLAEGLGIKEIVQSPTFNIMKIYFKAIRPLVHIDAYRLEDFMDEDIGLDEYIGYETGLTVIEWPMFLKSSLIPNNAINVEIKRLSDSQREIKFSSIDLNMMEGF